MQNWHSFIYDPSKALNYRILKINLELEEDFNILNIYDAIRFCRYRATTHYPPVETVNRTIKVNGEIFFHPIDKASAINNYFTSISKLESESDLPNVPPHAPCELSDITITEQEVIDQFRILNITKPVGPDK